jgi:hypothetical protein
MWIIRFSVSLETQSSKVCIKPEETVDLSTPLRFVEKHFQEGSAELQIPPLRFASVGMTVLLERTKERAKQFPWKCRLPLCHPDRSEA